MRGFGDLAGLDFLEGVDALAVGVEGVHQVHPAISRMSACARRFR